MRSVEILLIGFFAVASVLFLLFSILIRGFSVVSAYFTPVEVVGMVILILLLILIGIRGKSSK